MMDPLLSESVEKNSSSYLNRIHNADVPSNRILTITVIYNAKRWLVKDDDDERMSSSNSAVSSGGGGKVPGYSM